MNGTTKIALGRTFFYMRCQGNNDCTVCKYFFAISNLQPLMYKASFKNIYSMNVFFYF